MAQGDPHGPIGPVEGLVSLAFLGGEALILLRDERQSAEIRSWLRRFGEVIRAREQAAAPARRTPRPSRRR